MAIAHTLTRAVGTLTVSDDFDDTETCIIGLKTYTMLATLTDTDGYVHIGADAEATLTNLAAAINLSNEGESAVGAGTDYAASTTIHPDVKATSYTATTLVVQAKTPGTVGNFIDTTETGDEHAWGAATLAGGAGDVDSWATSLLALNQINSEVVMHVRTVLTQTAD